MIRWLLLIGALAAAFIGSTAEYAAALHPPGMGWDAMASPLGGKPFPRSPLRPIQYNGVQREVPNATGTAGQPIPLRVEIPAEFRKAQFLVIRGVPQEISLSAGFRAGTAWYVPFDEMAGLEISAPANFAGNFVFDATLFKELQGGPIGQIYLTVAIRAPNLARTAQPSTSALSQAPRARARRPLSSADERASLARGIALLRQGDVVTARMVFLDLAKRGSSQGARAMGETYDPVFLSRIFIAGLRPDPAEARRWYGLAIEMGDKEAGERLAALGAGIEQ